MKVDGLVYCGVSFYTHPNYCVHFCGATRLLLYGDEIAVYEPSKVDNYIIDRLRNEYKFEYKEFRK